MFTTVVMTSNEKINSVKPKRQISREDSMEYFIKFPMSNVKNNIPKIVDEMEKAFVYNEINVPIVLLIGWADNQDLMKFSKIYEDRGLITVRYSTPMESLLWDHDILKPIGVKIVRLLLDMNFDSHPFIVHMFSNGGAYLYHHIQMAVKQLNSWLDIRGLIMDSAPCDRHLTSVYRATSAIYAREQKNNCAISWLIALVFLTSWIFENLFRRFIALIQSLPYEERNLYKLLRHDAVLCPQLILYSKQDKLVSYKDVEYFAKHREHLGVPVNLVCFENAEHVQLYASNPEQYVHSVCQFVNDCLMKTPETSTMGNKKME